MPNSVPNGQSVGGKVPDWGHANPYFRQGKLFVCINNRNHHKKSPFFQILRNHVMVRVGGGWDTLQHYLYKHDPCRCKSGTKKTLSLLVLSDLDIFRAIMYRKIVKTSSIPVHGSTLYSMYLSFWSKLPPLSFWTKIPKPNPESMCGEGLRHIS